MNTPSEYEPFSPSEYLKEAMRESPEDGHISDKVLLEMMESAYIVGQLDMRRRVVDFLDRMEKARKAAGREFSEADAMLHQIIEAVEEAEMWPAEVTP